MPGRNELGCLYRDITSTHVNKEQEAGDYTAVIDLTHQRRMISGNIRGGAEKDLLSVPGLELTESDKHVLLGGMWLNDEYIHTNQILMKNDDLLPVASLQNPLLQQNLHFDSIGGEVQILHSGNHWLMISTAGTCVTHL